MAVADPAVVPRLVRPILSPVPMLSPILAPVPDPEQATRAAHDERTNGRWWRTQSRRATGAVLLQDWEQRGRIDRLHGHMADTKRARPAGSLRIASQGERGNPSETRIRRQGLVELLAVHAGHQPVEHHEAATEAVPEPREGLLGASRGDHIEAFRANEGLQSLTHADLIFDHKNSVPMRSHDPALGWARRAGRAPVAPLNGALVGAVRARSRELTEGYPVPLARARSSCRRPPLMTRKRRGDPPRISPFA